MLASKPQKAPPPKIQLSGAGLNSVSFLNSNDGWAVGYADPQDGEGAVCVHWDGNLWTRFSCLGSKDSSITAVKAIATNDVWAIGKDNGSDVAVHWDGKKWTKVQLDPTNKNPVVLTTIDATSSKDVWTAGMTTTGDKFVGVIERWDGKAWKISYLSRGVASPFVFMYSLSAAAANNAWTVLFVDRTAENPMPEEFGPDLLHWDGHTWKPYYIPGKEIVYSVRGIVAESADSAWAVGENSKTKHNMIAHWDGNVWRIVPSVPFIVPFDNDDELKVIAHVSNKDLWAVGGTQLSIFFEHWDGSKWELVDPKQRGEVNSLSVVSSTDIWAVGQETIQNFDDATNKPAPPTFDALVGHWDGKAWTFSKPFASPSNTH